MGLVFPRLPPYLCQNVSALKSKHRAMKTGEWRENGSSFMLWDAQPVRPCAVQLPFKFCGSEIRFHLLERSPKLLVCPDVLSPIPSGETMDRGGGGVASEDRCSPFKIANQLCKFWGGHLKAAVCQHQTLIREERTFQEKLGHFTWGTCALSTHSWKSHI